MIQGECRPILAERSVHRLCLACSRSGQERRMSHQRRVQGHHPLFTDLQKRSSNDVGENLEPFGTGKAVSMALERFCAGDRLDDRPKSSVCLCTGPLNGPAQQRNMVDFCHRCWWNIPWLDGIKNKSLLCHPLSNPKPLGRGPGPGSGKSYISSVALRYSTSCGRWRENEGERPASFLRAGLLASTLDSLPSTLYPLPSSTDTKWDEMIFFNLDGSFNAPVLKQSSSLSYQMLLFPPMRRPHRDHPWADGFAPTSRVDMIGTGLEGLHDKGLTPLDRWWWGEWLAVQAFVRRWLCHSSMHTTDSLVPLLVLSFVPFSLLPSPLPSPLFPPPLSTSSPAVCT